LRRGLGGGRRSEAGGTADLRMAARRAGGGRQRDDVMIVENMLAPAWLASVPGPAAS